MQAAGFQRAPHLFGVLVAAGWLQFHRAQDTFFHCRGEMIIEAARQGQRAAPLQPGALLESINHRNGFLAGEQMIEQRAHCVDVRAHVGLSFAAFEVFRAGVAHLAQRGGVLRLAGLEGAGDAEIDQVQLSGAVQDNVIWREVAVDNGGRPAVQIG